MTDERLVQYEQRDVSNNTDVCTSDSRSNPAAGTLVHSTSGTDSRNWLQGGSCRAGRPAGADYLIGKQGTRYQLQPHNRYAYHAGISRFTLDRVYANNEVSEKLIGVELEYLDTEQPTFEQYDSLAELIVYIAPIWEWRWPFIILGHYAVARPLGRRSDPVSFDWGWLMGRLYVRAAQAGTPGLV